MATTGQLNLHPPLAKSKVSTLFACLRSHNWTFIPQLPSKLIKRLILPCSHRVDNEKEKEEKVEEGARGGKSTWRITERVRPVVRVSALSPSLGPLTYPRRSYACSLGIRSEWDADGDDTEHHCQCRQTLRRKMHSLRAVQMSKEGRQTGIESIESCNCNNANSSISTSASSKEDHRAPKTATAAASTVSGTDRVSGAAEINCNLNRHEQTRHMPTATCSVNLKRSETIQPNW